MLALTPAASLAAHTPLPPSAEGGGGSFAERMVEDIPPPQEYSCIPRTRRIRRYKKSRWRKPSAFLVSSSPVLNAACPRRLCQPPWTQPSCKEPHPTLRRNQLQRIVPTQTPAALRERGVWGERRFSQRSGLSPQNLCHLPHLFRREREGGDFSSEKSPPSQINMFLSPSTRRGPRGGRSSFGVGGGGGT